MSLEGTQIGQYRLLQLIGSGGMGDVYLAEDTGINHLVAMKLRWTEGSPYLDTSSTSSALESARLFQHEATTIARLKHPRILPLFTYGEEQVRGETVTYLVMPYHREGSLVTWLRQRSNSALLNPQDVTAFVVQAADALQYAHDHNVIHQDVKPANFFVCGSSDANTTIPDILLTDFYIAGFGKPGGTISATSHIVRSTAAYMAPEQWSGNPLPASDQYALAGITYFLLTGRHPFRGELEQVKQQHFFTMPQPPSAFNPYVSTGVDAIILQALDKLPTNRYPSIATFADVFQAQLGAVPNFANPDNSYIPLSFPGNQYEQVKVLNDNAAISHIEPNVVPNPQPPLHITPPTPVLPPPHRPNRRIGVIALIAVALILILSSGAIFTINTINAINTHNAHATATAFANAATIHINATNTAQTNANATAFAQSNTDATATAEVGAKATATFIQQHPNPYPPNTGTLVLYDSLNGSSTANWNEYNDFSGGMCQFTGGAFVVSITATNKMYYCYEGAYFSNFTFEVQMKIIHGDCGGMTFRLNDNANQMYLYQICQDGSFGLYALNNNVYTNLVTAPFSAQIRQGPGTTNILAVVATSSTITIYANHSQIGTVTDKRFRNGTIGLMADYYTSATDVAFTNARVWRL